jgi:hypothetical protein
LADSERFISSDARDSFGSLTLDSSLEQDCSYKQ